MNKKIKKVFRYGLFMTQYIGERLRGLDFSMPAASETAKNTVEIHGYTKTPEFLIRKMLKMLPLEPEEGRFLDIGCGKGLTMKVAKEKGYQKVAGIDLDEDLIRIAKKNMKKLGMEDVPCLTVDAVQFDGYGEYNVFFFFNPFNDTVLEPVVRRILESVRENPRTVYVIYHHPKYDWVMDRAGLKKIASLYDNLRDYDTYFYTLE